MQLSSKTTVFVGLALFAACLLVPAEATTDNSLPEVQNFTRSKICEWIHDHVMPYGRINFEGEEVSKNFDPEDEDYIYGVMSTMVPALVIGILSLLFFTFRLIIKTVICCCRCCGCRSCCCKDKKKPVANEDPEKKRCWCFQRKPKLFTCIFAFCTIIVIAGVVFGFFQNQEVTNGVLKVLDSLKDLDKNTDNVITQLTGVRDSMVDFKTAIGQVNTDFVTAANVINNAVPGSVSTTTFASSTTAIEGYVQTSVDAINSGIDVGDDIKIYDNVDGLNDVEDFNKYREYGQLGVLIALCLPYFFVFLTLCCGKLQNSCFVAFIVTYSAFIGFLGWVITSVETGMSVAIADMCYNTSGYIKSQITDPEASDFVNFYIDCTGDNPKLDELNSASQALSDSSSDLGEFLTQVDIMDQADASSGNNAASEIADLRSSLSAINGTVDTINTKVTTLANTAFSCNAVHNVYVKALKGICHSGLQGLAALAVVQGLESFCIFIAIYTMLKFLAYTRAGKAPEFMRKSFSGFVYKDDNDETAGDKDLNERL